MLEDARLRAAAGVLLGMLLVVVVSPIAVVVASAFIDPRWLGLSSETWGSTDRSTATWFGYVAELYGGSLLRSAAIALVVVVLAALIGAPAAYGISRARGASGRAARALLEVPLAVPGLAVAIGMIVAYPRARASPAALVVAHLLYALPFFVRATANALATVPLSELEEAAAAAGAGSAQRLRRIVLPLARPGLLAGGLMAFMISWGEFNVSFLLATPTTQTFPAALYLTYTTNSFPVAAAATVIFLAAAVPALAVLARITRTEAAHFGEAA